MSAYLSTYVCMYVCTYVYIYMCVCVRGQVLKGESVLKHPKTHAPANRDTQTDKASLSQHYLFYVKRAPMYQADAVHA